MKFLAYAKLVVIIGIMNVYGLARANECQSFLDIQDIRSSMTQINWKALGETKQIYTVQNTEDFKILARFPHLHSIYPMLKIALDSKRENQPVLKGMTFHDAEYVVHFDFTFDFKYQLISAEFRIEIKEDSRLVYEDKLMNGELDVYSNILELLSIADSNDSMDSARSKLSQRPEYINDETQHNLDEIKLVIEDLIKKKVQDFKALTGIKIYPSDLQEADYSEGFEHYLFFEDDDDESLRIQTTNAAFLLFLHLDK